MDAERTITIERRFRGPPESGNGGYTSGLLAAAAGVPVEIRLMKPPPLERPLAIREDKNGGLMLLDGKEPVATAVPKTFELEVPKPPSYTAALAAVHGFTGFKDHAYPGCFVCGPERERGDGMRIFASPMEAGRLFAAAWLPGRSLAGPDGKVKPEFMWSALDCPGFFATGAAKQGALLGLYAARVDRCVHVSEGCVVIGWALGHEGRKHYTGTAIFDGFGELCGRAIATWIEPRQ